MNNAFQFPSIVNIFREHAEKHTFSVQYLNQVSYHVRFKLNAEVARHVKIKFNHTYFNLHHSLSFRTAILFYKKSIV